MPKSINLTKSQLNIENENPSENKVNLFKKINSYLIEEIFEYLEFLEIKSYLPSLKNRKISFILIDILQRLKFILIF